MRADTALRLTGDATVSESKAAKEAARGTDIPPLTCEAIDELYSRLAATMPGRPPELSSPEVRPSGVTTAPGRRQPKGQKEPFKSCISCMLSAQSRDANTAKATSQLFRLARTPRTMLKLDDEVIAQAIRPAGLYNMKARNIRKFCTALLEEHGGVVPTTREGLMSLPGIGRKCADIVLSFTFGVDVIAVDTHVHRVCNRTGLARGKSEAQTAAALEARSPDWARRDGHFWLLQFGKRVCTSRAPKCPDCPVRDLCLWPDKRIA